MACAIALFMVFVIWINYPFAPNPVVLFKKTQTQMTIDAGPGSWSAAGRDLRHSRQVEIGPPPPAGKVSFWNGDVPGEPLESEPVAQDTHVYVGSSNGMYALSHQDMSLVERWEGDTPGRITGAAAVVGLHLFFGSTDHTVSSWDAYDGHVRWSFPAEDTVETSPVVVDGLVFISSGEGWVYALDALAGTLIWRTQLESNAGDAVAIHDGRLFVGDEKGIFYILSARTGQEWFRYRTPRAITGSPVISADGERAYFPSGGQLFAVDAKIREIPGLYQFKQLWAQLWLWQVPGVPRPKGQQGGLWRFTPENPLQGVKSSPALANDESGKPNSDPGWKR
jgi:outer membrane protein assembly factor BamB